MIRLPQRFDVIIVGTGLGDGRLDCCLAPFGKPGLHVDDVLAAAGHREVLVVGDPAEIPSDAGAPSVLAPVAIRSGPRTAALRRRA